MVIDDCFLESLSLSSIMQKIKAKNAEYNFLKLFDEDGFAQDYKASRGTPSLFEYCLKKNYYNWICFLCLQGYFVYM